MQNQKMQAEITLMRQQFSVVTSLLRQQHDDVEGSTLVGEKRPRVDAHPAEVASSSSSAASVNTSTVAATSTLLQYDTHRELIEGSMNMVDVFYHYIYNNYSVGSKWTDNAGVKSRADAMVDVMKSLVPTLHSAKIGELSTSNEERAALTTERADILSIINKRPAKHVPQFDEWRTSLRSKAGTVLLKVLVKKMLDGGVQHMRARKHTLNSVYQDYCDYKKLQKGGGPAVVARDKVRSVRAQIKATAIKTTADRLNSRSSGSSTVHVFPAIVGSSAAAAQMHPDMNAAPPVSFLPRIAMPVLPRSISSYINGK